MNTVPVGIVTTATRNALLRDTLTALGGNPADVHVYCDLEQGLTRNHLAAWEELFDTDPAATHALLLQDDIIATTGWQDAVEHCARALPDAAAISFYTGRKDVLSTAAQKRGYTRLAGKSWLNEQALLMRRDIWQDYLGFVVGGEYLDHIEYDDAWKHHDFLLQRFFAARGHHVYLIAPPIFQHVGVESSVGNPWRVFGRPRQAPVFPGQDFDAATHFRQLLPVR